MSMFKTGGGFLNDQDGVITGYKFVTASYTVKKGERRGEDLDTINTVLSVRQDGASEDVETTFYFTAYGDRFTVSKDGRTLEPVNDGDYLRGRTAWAKFITSLVAAGFPESKIGEAPLNFDSIIGARVRFAQERNPERGKRTDKKTGREFDRTDLIVTRYYGHATPTKPVSKSNGKTQTAVVDVSQEAQEAIVAIATENGGKVRYSQLALLLGKHLKGVENGDVIRRTAYDLDFIAAGATEGLWTFDPSDKNKVISVEA